ncbi:OmpH family outer membrane protein [Deinococcus taeanensis]|uniref:OmpH family outer membrane protein n=1 Tax=Deinococcus taeanensis TaxID=2737050 RepID=UPI001CDD429F|nr:OmpH family outer membrane protein [Deinococcus taeanensis]UBV43832.1 OmpH family outer membrane protein [Deinococcus taeanensis]
MNKALLLLPLALLATVPHAQQTRSRVGIVNVQSVVKGMAGSKTYLDLNTKATADLKARAAAIQTLAAKAARGTAADKSALTKAQQAYAASRTEYTRQIEAAFKPLASKVNASVAKVAKANGYTIVLDENVAAQTSLVVYANKTAVDLTQAVLKDLK